jgi:TPR repeat protein
MNYPLISEYIEAIKSAEDNFEELSYLRPVLGDDGEPVMSAGGFSVVFKMKDKRDGRLYAVKCFTKDQEGRAENYKLIADELEFVSSNYLTSIKYYERELFVDTDQTEETEFPVLLMDWVEGKTLDLYIKENAKEKYLLEMLTFQFCKLASWLLSQSFAHGDLKPDNILVKEDGKIVLVDYDGMYVPSMKGQKAKEIGSPGFRHPKRTEDIFDETIDDFSIAIIAMSLKAFALNKELIDEYCLSDLFFFRESDITYLNKSKALSKLLELLSDEEFCSLYGAFMIAFANNNLSLVSLKLWSIRNPKKGASYGEYIYNQARNFCEEAKDNSKIDYNKAFKLFLKAAQLGNADAQCCVGCCFKCGYGTQVDYTEARVWYDKSSKNGCARALRHIAFCYHDGLGVKQDINKAIEWYDKAIDAGDISSMVSKGAIFYYGKNGIIINYEEAAKWYKKAAEKGDSDGMWRLALCYERGNGLEKNFEKAFEWFKKSAEKDNANGLFGLGECYYRGYGIEKNYKKAVSLYGKAIEEGHTGALWHLGCCYEYGYGVEIDLNAAYTLYEKSSEEGSSEGMWRLGGLYEKGLGVKQDLERAKSLYEKAANLGHKNAIDKLNVLKNDALPFPVIPETGISPIQYPEPKESVKRKIRKQFLSVDKDPYYSYFAIINTLICKNSNSDSNKIRSIWIPSEIDNQMNVKMVINGKNVECTYSQYGVVSSFIHECNTRNIEDVVELTYELLNRLGLVGYFISNGTEAINKMNEMKVLNDRTGDLPF